MLSKRDRLVMGLEHRGSRYIGEEDGWQVYGCYLHPGTRRWYVSRNGRVRYGTSRAISIDMTWGLDTILGKLAEDMRC